MAAHNVMKDTYSSKERGARLTKLRKTRGLDQQNLSDILSELLGNEKQFSVATISSWETGRRSPTKKTLDVLAGFYGVSVNYLLCLTDDPYDTSDNENSQTVSEDIVISVKDLQMFDGKPVYLEFQNNLRQHQWALVNCTRGCFVLKDDFIRFTSPEISKINIKRPEYYDVCSLNGGAPLNISQLINYKNAVFVKMITSDLFIQGQYNGWYRHNEKNTALTNSRGLVLPYEGLGVSYYAYTKTQKI